MADSVYYSEQYQDFILNSETTPYCRITYSHGRSRDAREVNQPSEDYLVYRYHGNVVTLAICDGVGQSIGADYAARFLADKLLDYFGSLYNFADSSNEHFINYLNSFLEEAQKFIDQSPNPCKPGTTSYSFYEEQRKEGAEVKFIAGLVDFHSNKIVLFSLGDLLFAALDKEGQIWPGPETHLGNWILRVNQKERQVPTWKHPGAWSSTRGVLIPKALVTWIGKVSALQRVILASDGLIEPFRKIISNQPNYVVDEDVEAACKVGKDDISYLKIDFYIPRVQQLIPIQRCYEEGNLLIWEPVTGADVYRIILITAEGKAKFQEIRAEQHYIAIPFGEASSIKIQALSNQFITSPWFEYVLLGNTKTERENDDTIPKDTDWFYLLRRTSLSWQGLKILYSDIHQTKFNLKLLLVGFLIIIFLLLTFLFLWRPNLKYL